VKKARHTHAASRTNLVIDGHIRRML